MAKTTRYCEYFDIDEKYFPCVDDSAIKADPECWKRTFPHETFIEMLRSFESCLAGQKSTLWIQGAHGTGKSQCAYTLKKLLEVPEEELRKYWADSKPLEKHPGLLESLVGHRNRGIVAAYRYASGSIASPRDLFLAVQESIKKALHEKGLYEGEDTLKESVIAWIDKPANKMWLNTLLEQTEYSAMFAQSTADEILKDLRKEDGEIKKLMDNIFRLADNEGVTALNIDSDRLIAWLTDVIDKNNTKVVLVWDEFSDYFKANRESFTEFQKIAALVQHKPFYFIVVTHYKGSIYTGDKAAWKTVSDRFIDSNITLPRDRAFRLIGQALKKNNAAESAWAPFADALNKSVISSRVAVMKEIGVKDPQVIMDIMPLHPMAALLLKNIAEAFQSNQRSMFDFIKSSDTKDLRAFQWFIKETGPQDGHPLLTVDMLWNFFYEKGKDNLESDIRRILDTFQQQKNLREDEKAVLKAILIMQAIDQRSGGTIDLFKATDQNLAYVFEGINSGLDVSCKNIAKGLLQKEILVLKPIGNGRYVYAAAVLAGDQAKIDGFKEEIRGSTTAKLVTEGGLASVLQLSPPLRLRYGTTDDPGKITPVTVDDFTRTINGLREKPVEWKFHAVIAFAKDDAEAVSFRKQVRVAAADEQYKNIVFIDALSTPLGMEAFEQYVDNSAMAMYYQSNNNDEARGNNDKARNVLVLDWKNRIYSGQFVVYTYANQEGEKLAGGCDVATALQTVVINRFPDVFDFAKGLTESQLKLSKAGESAIYGIKQGGKGSINGVETKVFQKDVWKIDKYWETAPSLKISRIKVEIDNLIEAAFCRDGEGQISIGEIYDFLEKKYGFAPCNLSAFLAGFLLKEYGGEPYRYSDSAGKHETMSQDKLAEMLGNYINKSAKPTYIVKMTPNEMAFYDLTEKSWDFPQNSFSSVGKAVTEVIAKMRTFGLPVWCLSEVDTNGVFDVVQMYIELVQLEGKEAHSKAIKIGEVATVKTTLAKHLGVLLTIENCQNGMREFLKAFDGGKIQALADEIGASGNILSDIRAIFSSVEYSCLWLKTTGEDVIRRLLTDYGIVKETNAILNANAHSKTEAFKEWRERLRFIGISCEAFKAKYPTLATLFDALLKISRQEDMQTILKEFHSKLSSQGAEIRDLLNDSDRVFTEIYEPYLEGLSEADISDVKSKVGTGLFELSKTDCNFKVKDEADRFRKNQLRTQMVALWNRKTGTKNARDWSNRYRTPILCCVSADEFDTAKKAFDTLNGTWSPDSEIKAAIEFLDTTTLYDTLSDDIKRDAAFVRDIIGEYSAMLPNIEKVRDALDRFTVDTYDWRDNPSIEAKVMHLAEAEYDAGGSDKVIAKIDKMTDAELKDYLKRLVREKKNIKVGIAIIKEGGE